MLFPVEHRDFPRIIFSCTWKLNSRDRKTHGRYKLREFEFDLYNYLDLHYFVGFWLSLRSNSMHFTWWHITRTGGLFLFKKDSLLYILLFFFSCRWYRCWCMRDTCSLSRSRLLASCTWSADRPIGLMQPGLRESRERTAFEREFNAPPGPRSSYGDTTATWTRCLSMPHQCALLYSVPTRLYLASPRPSSSRLALTCLLA